MTTRRAETGEGMTGGAQGRDNTGTRGGDIESARDAGHENLTFFLAD
jgi:hypothetical protein